MCILRFRKTAIFNLLKIYTFDLNARLWFSEIGLIPLAEYCRIYNECNDQPFTKYFQMMVPIQRLKKNSENFIVR